MKLYNRFEPAVSIILPTYNRANLIERAVISILKQSLSKWELIIVDDGSTDKTYKLINKFISDHQNIRYLKHSNRKLPLSLNAGISASAGEFIAFLGSDDEYSEDYLSARVNYMKDNLDVDLIYGGVKIIGDPYVPDKNDPKKKIHINECIVGGTFFGRRNIFFELNGFNHMDYSEDSEFFERAAKKYSVRKVDLPDYIYYRDTVNSITNSMQ